MPRLSALSTAPCDYMLPLLERLPVTWSARPLLAVLACLAMSHGVAHSYGGTPTAVGVHNGPLSFECLEGLAEALIVDP